MTRPGEYDVERPEFFNIPAESRTQVQAREDYATNPELGIDETGQVHIRPPVEVAIVGPMPEPEITDWSSARYFVDDTRAIQIAGSRRNRRKLQIYLDSAEAESVSLSRSPTDSAAGTALLSNSNFPIVFEHNEEVWAIGTSTGCYVNVIAEYITDNDEEMPRAR